MDFLDPKYRQAYKIRLLIGYFLLAIAIILGTIILVYAVYGYGINTKNGQIVQNGLLFVDSKPSGAKIALNGKDQNATTSARLVLPGGDYSMTLSKTGYKSWTRNFTLDEHNVKRLNYAFLFPAQPVIAGIKNYQSVPALATQSPDLRWLILQTTGLALEQQDLNDLNKTPETLSLPTDLFSSSDGSLAVVDWSSDSNKLVLVHSFAGQIEFILLDREKPSNSVNLNKLFKLNLSQVALHDNKADQLYLYDQTTKVLELGNTQTGVVAAQTIKQVLSFTALSGNLVYFATPSATSGDVDIKIADNDQVYKVETIKAQPAYELKASEFQGHWYYLAPAASPDTFNLYQDPITSIKDPSFAKASPITNFTVTGLTQTLFAPNGRNLSLSNGKDFVVYDLENKVKSKFSLSTNLAGLPSWMDNYHLIGNRSGSVWVIDFDGANEQLISSTALSQGGYFTKDYKHLATIKQNELGTYDLVNIDLRAGVDLPKP